MLAVLLASVLSAQGHEMHMSDSTGWRSSVHGTAFLQYVRTFDTRATYQVGSVNRVMFESGGPWAGGRVRVRGMGSAEPLTLTDRGAPQPLQIAFTSGGETITDHMHPSPWIMELALSYDRKFSEGVAASIYGAAIGEPALGPPVYVHRSSAAANPAVPLSHHAQDVTHSSFGVVTIGVYARRLRLEGSSFNDRQPEEPSTVFFYRGARLDAHAVRITFAAGTAWSLAGSYGYLPAASGGHTHEALHRMSLALVRNAAPWFITVAFGANDPVGREPPSRALLAEGERRWNSEQHVLFARAEYVQRTAEELSLVGSVNPRQDIEALQVGYSYGRRVRLGGYATMTRIPPQLEPFYGSRTPLTVAVFGQFSWAAAVP